MMSDSEVFEGRSGEMRTSQFLASEDLQGVEAEVEIEACIRHRNVQGESGRVEPVVYSLKFKGKDRQLWLNSTNRKVLANRFGVDVREWSGKKVTLYVDPNVKMKGKKVGGIRIK